MSAARRTPHRRASRRRHERTSPGRLLGALGLALVLIVVSACGAAAPHGDRGPAAATSATATAAVDGESYPRTAGMFLGQDAPDWNVLGRHDLLIVDMEWAHRAPEQLRRIRARNPRVQILAYVTIEEIVRPATIATLSDYFRYRKRLARGIQERWWLRTAGGGHLSLYDNTWMLDPASGWGSHLARFMARTVMGSGHFDGIYYDNAWASPNWLGGHRVDLDRDGRDDRTQHGDAWIAARWDSGMARVLRETVRLAPRAILMGNGAANHYERWGDPWQPPHHRWLHGALDEHWPAYTPSLAAGRARITGWLERARPRALFVLQSEPAGWRNDPLSDLPRMRHAFATAQIHGAHFAYSRGDHQQSWWLDEFDGAGRGRHYLGRARGDADTVAGVLLREYAGGLVLANDGPTARTITLPGGPWRALAGRQDRAANHGRPVTRITLAPRDGRVLVRAAPGR